MKHIIFVVLLAMALSGCAGKSLLSLPLADESKLLDSGVIGFASLSDPGDPVDEAASVVYTKLALYRYKAAKLLRSQAIPVDMAIVVQARADGIRADLEAALKQQDPVKIGMLAMQLVKFDNMLKEEK